MAWHLKFGPISFSGGVNSPIPPETNRIINTWGPVNIWLG